MRILTIIVISMFLVSCAPPKTGRAGPAASKEPVVVAPPEAPKPCDATKELCDRYGRKVEALRDEAPKVLAEAEASAIPSGTPECDWDKCIEKSGWVTIGEPWWVEEECKEQQYIEQEYHHYYCNDYGDCVPVVTERRKIKTRNTDNIKDNVKLGIPMGDFLSWSQCCEGEKVSRDNDHYCGNCDVPCDAKNKVCVAKQIKVGAGMDIDYRCEECDPRDNIRDEKGSIIGNPKCDPMDSQGVIEYCHDNNNCVPHRGPFTREQACREAQQKGLRWCLDTFFDIGFCVITCGLVRDDGGGGTTTPGGTTPTPSEPQKPAPPEQTPQP